MASGLAHFSSIKKRQNRRYAPFDARNISTAWRAYSWLPKRGWNLLELNVTSLGLSSLISPGGSISPARSCEMNTYERVGKFIMPSPKTLVPNAIRRWPRVTAPNPWPQKFTLGPDPQNCQIDSQKDQQGYRTLSYIC